MIYGSVCSGIESASRYMRDMKGHRHGRLVVVSFAGRLLRDGAWNEGKSYAICEGEHCYRSRAAWAKAVIRHYGNQCMSCGWDKARCDAHHREPKAKGGKHTIQNGMVLCPNCHRIAHEAGGGC